MVPFETVSTIEPPWPTSARVESDSLTLLDLVGSASGDQVLAKLAEVSHRDVSPIAQLDLVREGELLDEGRLDVGKRCHVGVTRVALRVPAHDGVMLTVRVIDLYVALVGADDLAKRALVVVVDPRLDRRYWRRGSAPDRAPDVRRETVRPGW